MIVLSLFALIAILTISVLHFLWAAKIWWPVRDEAQLARSVAGFPGIDRMPPPTACLFVALSLLIVAALLLATLLTEPAFLIRIALAVASLVFLARGAIGFTRFWARLTPEQPFRHLDRRYYSPLCLGIGVALILAA